MSFTKYSSKPKPLVPHKSYSSFAEASYDRPQDVVSIFSTLRDGMQHQHATGEPNRDSKDPLRESKKVNVYLSR